MLKVDNFEVYFKHYPQRRGTITVKHPGRLVLKNNKLVDEIEYVGTTVCVLSALDTGEVIAEGLAFCSKQDIYSKAKGRKISLRRAVVGLPREDRTAIWLRYFEVSTAGKNKENHPD